MFDSDCSDFLNFLSEPRTLKDVAERFGASASSARRHLQKAIEQRQVIAFKCSRKAYRKAQRKQRSRETVFYISRDGGFLPKELVGFAVKGMTKALDGAEGSTAFVKFKSKGNSKSSFSSKPKSALDYEGYERRSTRFPRIKAGKEKLVASARQRHSPMGKIPRQNQTKSLSTVEKLSMLTALSRRSLSYLELHSRFKVSKQTIKTLTRNGVVEAVWGPMNVGINYGLTKKGMNQLKRLRAAARLNGDEIRKATIHLKHRGS